MTYPNVSPIAILGAGSWGTALALHLAKQAQPVTLWSNDPAHVARMAAEKKNNRYLPDYPFPDCLQVTSQLDDAIANTSDILIAVPSVGFRSVLIALHPFIKPSTPVAWVTKGLDLTTGELLHHVATEVLGAERAYGILSGPSFAREVAAGKPTAVVIASTEAAYARDLMLRFNSPVFRVYLSTDIIGVEVGGIVKNVLAIATGMVDGMQLGANARCALITRGLAEMIRLGIALGGQYETFAGLTGVGDLVLTCTDDQSRNRRFGLALGQGKTIHDAERMIGQVIEGKRNAELVVSLAQKHQVEMPITETVWQVLQAHITLQEAVQRLLSRAQKAEH